MSSVVSQFELIRGTSSGKARQDAIVKCVQSMISSERSVDEISALMGKGFCFFLLEFFIHKKKRERLSGKRERNGDVTGHHVKFLTQDRWPSDN